MNTDTVSTAKAEAKRFLSVVKALEEEIARQKLQNEITGGRYSYISTPKQSGALRRASMDLTRALADLRRAG
jgi:hypothetical protein